MKSFAFSADSFLKTLLPALKYKLMNLRKIIINNFRNIENLELNTAPGFNLIVGENAQGKSNFLEAVYCLGLGKSGRTNREDDLIRFETPSALVSGLFAYNNQEFNLGMMWEKQAAGSCKKTIHFNGNPLQKLSDFLDKSPMVMMTADDLDIIRGVPDGRRKILDLISCRLYPAHVSTLRNYKSILESRNRWLKLPPDMQDRGLGEIYDQKLAELGADIIQRRIQIIDYLQPMLQELYADVFGGEMPLIRYRTSIKNLRGKTVEFIREAFTDTVLRLSTEEKRRKFTMMGPHRDDFDFRQKGKSMKFFSSFGQMRGAAVIFKLAEIRTIREKTGKSPIVLIDDCLHEFDRMHMDRFFDYLMGKSQVFYTSTSVPEHLAQIKEICGYNMRGGDIKPWNL